MAAAKHGALGKRLHDFLVQILRLLGGSLGVNYCCRDRQGGIQEVHTLFISCPQEAWVAMVGEPQHVQRHFDPSSGKWLRAWEQDLPDGRVRCVGHFLERSPGNRWIIVRKLSIPRTDS
jgi:hypothetical protein